jgi:hypothetical protein
VTPARALYVATRLAIDIGSLASRALNALAFGGSTAQTTSARAHIEATTSPVWERRRRAINAAFFWQTDHCAASWENEVDRARYVLSRLEGGPPHGNA